MGARSVFALGSSSPWLALASAVLMALVSVSCARPAPPPPSRLLTEAAGTAGEPRWFQVPEGWRIVTTSATSTRLVLPGGAGDVWISVIGPMFYSGRSGDLSFEQWFSMFQEPGATRGSEIGRGIDGAGHDTLFQVLINDEESPSWRVYSAIREGNRAVLMILLAPTEQAVEAAVPAFEALGSSLRWEAAPSP